MTARATLKRKASHAPNDQTAANNFAPINGLLRPIPHSDHINHTKGHHTMAKINHPHLFTFDHFESGTRKTVGNNRQVSHSQQGWEDIITGTLHGHAIFTLKRFRQGTMHTPSFVEFYTLTLNTCGYATTTTRAAMADFLKAAGIRAGVSMAGGELNVKLMFDDGGSSPLRTIGDVCEIELTPRDWEAFTWA